MNPLKNYRIISCDGGGFRGFLTSQILVHIEEQLRATTGEQNLKLGDYFDMYAGTSTGALIACGLASGRSAQQVRDIYSRVGPKIFPDVHWMKEIKHRLSQVANIFNYLDSRNISSYHRFHFSTPLFDGTELKTAIEDEFKGTKFGELACNNKRVIVTAYDCWNSQPIIFDTAKKEHRELNITDVLLASAAYPGGFPSHSLSGVGLNNTNNASFFNRLRFQYPGWTLPPDESLSFADGGLIANNPALLALIMFLSNTLDPLFDPDCIYRDNDDKALSNLLHEALSKLSNDGEAVSTLPNNSEALTSLFRKALSELPKILVASFGTGRLVLKFDNHDSKKMGLADWVFPLGDPLLEVVYGGYSKMADWYASFLLQKINGGEDKYFRFQPYISGSKSSSFISKFTTRMTRDNKTQSPAVSNPCLAQVPAVSNPDLVSVLPEERKDFESATFQFRHNRVLQNIAQKYLNNGSISAPHLGITVDKQANSNLPVNLRIERLINNIL